MIQCHSYYRNNILNYHKQSSLVKSNISQNIYIFLSHDDNGSILDYSELWAKFNFAASWNVACCLHSCSQGVCGSTCQKIPSKYIIMASAKYMSLPCLKSIGYGFLLQQTASFSQTVFSQDYVAQLLRCGGNDCEDNGSVVWGFSWTVTCCLCTVVHSMSVFQLLMKIHSDMNMYSASDIIADKNIM